MSMGSNPGVEVPLGLNTAGFIRGLIRAGKEGRQFAGQFIGFQARMQAAADRAAARIAEVQLRTSATVAAAQARGAASVANAQRRADAMVADSQRRVGDAMRAQRQSQVAHVNAMARARAAVMAAQNQGDAAQAAAQQRYADARFRQMQAQMQQARSVRAAQTRVVYAQDRAAASVAAAQDRAAASVGAAQDRAQKAVANAHARAAQQARDSRQAIEAQMAAIRAQMTKTWGERFGDLMDKAKKKLGAFLKDLRAFGGIVASRIGMAIGRDAAGAAGMQGVLGGLGLTASREQAMTMETAMARLQRATGAADDRVRQLGMDLRRIAVTTPGAKLSDIFEIAIGGAKLGIADDQLKLFTRDMAKVSVVLEDIPIDEATIRFSRLLNVFHLGTDQAIRMASALNKLDLSSNASARDILDVTNRMAAASSFMGMSLPRTMALATSLRETGVPIETSGTAMSQVMSRMADRRFTGHFAGIAGMDPRAFRQLMQRDVLGSIEAVERGLGRMSRERGVEVLNRLSLDGQRVRSVMLSLGTVIPQLGRHVRDAEKDMASIASIQDSFARAAGLTQSQIDLMKNNIQLTAEALGKHLLPVTKGFVTGFADLTTDLRGWLSENDAMFKSWGKTIATVMDSVGGLWRDFPLYVELGTAMAKRAWEGFTAFMTRAGKVGFEAVEYGAKIVGTFAVNLAKQVVYAIDMIVEGAVGKITDVLKGIPGNLFGIGAGAGAGAGQGARDLFKGIFGGGGQIQAAGAGVGAGGGVAIPGVGKIPLLGQAGPALGAPAGIADLFTADRLFDGIAGIKPGPNLAGVMGGPANAIGQFFGRLMAPKERGIGDIWADIQARGVARADARRQAGMDAEQQDARERRHAEQARAQRRHLTAQARFLGEADLARGPVDIGVLRGRVDVRQANRHDAALGIAIQQGIAEEDRAAAARALIERTRERERIRAETARFLIPGLPRGEAPMPMSDRMQREMQDTIRHRRERRMQEAADRRRGDFDDEGPGRKRGKGREPAEQLDEISQSTQESAKTLAAVVKLLASIDRKGFGATYG